MKLKRRFILNLLGPAPIAAALLVFTFASFENDRFVEAVRWLPFYVLFGYLYAILPSAAHAWWLHRRYRAGLNPRSRRAVGLSAASGLCAGLVITLFFAVPNNGNVGSALLFIPLGAATGALNGLLQFLIRETPAAPR